MKSLVLCSEAVRRVALTHFKHKRKLTLVVSSILAIGWGGIVTNSLRADGIENGTEREAKTHQLEKAHRLVVSRMERGSGDPQQRLYGALSMLHLLQTQPTPFLHVLPSIRALVETRWPVSDDKPVRQTLEDLELKWPATQEQESGNNYVARWREFAWEFEMLTGRRLKTDWRGNREFWLDFVTSIVEAKRSENSAPIWEEKIKSDGEHADLYRIAYAEVLRLNPDRRIKAEILQPLLDAEGRDAEERLLRAFLLGRLANKGRTTKDEQLRHRAKSQVMQQLADRRTVFIHRKALLHAFLDFYRSLESVDRTLVARTLFRHHNPSHVRFALSVAGVSENKINRWFLARKTTLVVENVSLSDALSKLAGQVYLPLWFDPAVSNDQQPVTLAANGTWLEMLDAVLDKTPYQAFFFEEDIIWVGRPTDRKAAEQLLRNALAKAAKSPRLLESTEVEFVDTGWRDTFDFLVDLHNLNLVKLWAKDQATGAVTLKLAGVPMCLVLEIIAKREHLAWDFVENTLVVLPSNRSEDFTKLQHEYRRRLVTLSRLALDDKEIEDRLAESTELEFVQTELIDGIEFINNLHDVWISTIGDERARSDVNFIISGVPARWALTLVLAEHGMVWDIDEERIIVGTPDNLPRYKQLAADRVKRRLNYPAGVADKLRGPIYFKINEDEPDLLLRLLSEKIGIKVSFGPKAQVPTKQMTIIDPGNVPADVVLDMVAAHFGVEWKVSKEGTVLMDVFDKRQPK